MLKGKNTKKKAASKPVKKPSRFLTIKYKNTAENKEQNMVTILPHCSMVMCPNIMNRPACITL